MKIYTRTGDEGQTGLFAGARVSKDDPRIEAYGTVDELNAMIGQVRAGQPGQQVDEILSQIQNYLFVVGGQLATPDPSATGIDVVDASAVTELERWIDDCERELEPLKQFILPAGTPLSAGLHLARTICRRAERRVVTLASDSDVEVSPTLIHYLNRLSDFLFVLARVANARAGVQDVPWKKPSQ